MNKISVIIPIYNVEPYLKKCLDSIVNQTYKDIEIICVNDGSTDNSLQIIKEYAKADFRIKIIDKENGGLSSARNEGLKIANGEWISFVDSDDWLDIYAYEKLEKYFHYDPDIICFGTHIRGDVSDKLLQTDNEYLKIRYEDLVDLTDEIRLLTNVGAWNKLWKKSIIDTYELTFPVGMHYEDYSFYWNYIFESKNAYYVKEKFYNYLRRSNSIMANTFNKTSTKTIDHLYASELIYDHLKKRDLLELHIKTFAKIFLDCFFFSYWNSNIKHKKNVLFKATELLKKFNLGEDFNNQNDVIKHIANAKYYKIPGIDYGRPFLQKLFSIRNSKDNRHRIVYILGIKFKYRNIQKEILEQLASIKNEIAMLKSQLNEKVDKSINNGVERLVTQNTANFVLANMSKAKIFTSEFDVLSYAISQAKKDGLFLEFGVYRARTINYIAKQILDNTIYGFDSFEGLPEDWRIGFEKGIFGLDKLPTVDPNVELIKGWFNDTLPTFIDSHKDDCAFIHIDCDLYSSTKTIFNYLGNKIKKGTIIVFDEYFNYPGWEEHEHKAFMEFVMSNNIKFEYIAYNEKHEQVAVRII